MNSNFNILLRNQIIKSNIPQSEVVEYLKSYDQKLFSGLDTNTVNRWLSGRSEPNMQRKLNVLSTFNIDLLDYIGHESYTISKREEKFFSDYFAKIDSYLPSLGYIEYSDIKTTLETLSKQELRKEYNSFYRNNSAFIRLRDKLDVYNEDYSFNVIRLTMKNAKIGHFAYTNSIGSALINTLNLSNHYSNCICIIPAYYINSEAMKLLIVEFLIKAIKERKHSSCKKALIFITIPHVAKLFGEKFEAKLVHYFPRGKTENPTDKGMYLFEFDLLKMLSSAYIFNLVKNRLMQVR